MVYETDKRSQEEGSRTATVGAAARSLSVRLNGAKKTKPAAKQNKGEGFNGSLLKDSFTFVDNSDSELSDLPEVNDSSTKSRMAKKVTPKSSEIQPPRVKAKARPKSNPIVPPTFERVDTRLTRSQVEDRMAVSRCDERFNGSFANTCSAFGSHYPSRNETSLYWTISIGPLQRGV